MSKAEHGHGFTLVELLVVLLLVGALAVVGSAIIVQPFEATEDLTRRARLVDAADLTLERMARDIRVALPNSLRVDNNGNVRVVEFIPVLTGGRYRRYNDPGTGADEKLALGAPSGTFDVLGGLPSQGAVNTGSGNCADNGSSTTCMNVYNTGQNQYDVYDSDNLARITDFDAQSPPGIPHDRLDYARVGGGPTFRAHSPRQRFYLFNTVVSYVCDQPSGRLFRYSGYGLDPGGPTADPGGTAHLMVDGLETCRFVHESGTSTRNALLTIVLDFRVEGAPMTLFKQIHVFNAP